MTKANFYYEQNRKNESMANWKAKKNNNNYDQKKKEFVPNWNSKIIRPEIFLTRISKGIRIIHRAIITMKWVKSLLILMVVTLKNLNEKNP